MRSTRLAALAVAVGAGLLAWSTAGVSGLSGTLSAASSTSAATSEHVASGRFVDDVHRRGHGDGSGHGGDGRHDGHRGV